MRPLFRILERVLITAETRLAWERTRIDKAFGIEIAKARAAKDYDKVESLKHEHSFEIDLHDEVEDEFITGKLLSKARRLRVPIPHRHNADKTESEYWYEGNYTGCWYLTARGVATLRDEIRRELKAKHEARSQWMFWLTGLTGVIGSLTGLVALLNSKAP